MWGFKQSIVERPCLHDLDAARQGVSAHVPEAQASDLKCFAVRADPETLQIGGLGASGHVVKIKEAYIDLQIMQLAR
jgi:hypothetical protein